MPNFPKLKIRHPFGSPSEDICELEQVEYRFSHCDEILVGPEGREQASYRFSYGEDVLFMV